MANATIPHPVRASYFNFIHASIERLRAASEPDELSQQAVEMVGRAMDIFDLKTSFQTRLGAFLPRLHHALNNVQPSEGNLPAREDPALGWWREFAEMLLTLSADHGEVVVPFSDALLEADTFDGLKTAVSEMMGWACTHELSLVEFRHLQDFARDISSVDDADREDAFNNAALDTSNLVLMINYSDLLLRTLAGVSALDTTMNDLQRFRAMSNEYLEGHFGDEFRPDVEGREEWIALTDHLTASEVAELGEEGCCICKYCEAGDDLLRFSCKCTAAFHRECISSYLLTRDADGRRPTPSCIQCRQEIDHLPRLPIGGIENIPSWVQRLRDHPEDGRNWGLHTNSQGIQLTPARAEYDIHGLRSARGNEAQYIRTLNGPLIPARYNINGEYHPSEGLEILAGVRGPAGVDAIPFLFCGSCWYCSEGASYPAAPAVTVPGRRFLDLAKLVAAHGLTPPWSTGGRSDSDSQTGSASIDQESSTTQPAEQNDQGDDGSETADDNQASTIKPNKAQPPVVVEGLYEIRVDAPVEDNAQKPIFREVFRPDNVRNFNTNGSIPEAPEEAPQDSSDATSGNNVVVEQPSAAVEGLFEIRVDAPIEDGATEPVHREVFRSDKARSFHANGVIPRAPAQPRTPWDRNRYTANSLAFSHNDMVSMGWEELMQRIRDMPSK